jgi:chemotaxis regulatin CheY-phosphate phosphatase CheZ
MSGTEASDSDIEYEAIEEAIMQNPRGRWFLTEYARRNRTADTDRLLEAIDRLYNAALETRERVAPESHEPQTADLDFLWRGLQDMRAAIDTARRDMAEIKPRETTRFENAEEAAAAVASSAERATLDILAAVERLQDIADTLHTGGADGDLCDEIETHARGIFMASAFQDITGQRIARLVGALTDLDRRIAAIMAQGGVSAVA